MDHRDAIEAPRATSAADSVAKGHSSAGKGTAPTSVPQRVGIHGCYEGIGILTVGRLREISTFEPRDM